MKKIIIIIIPIILTITIATNIIIKQSYQKHKIELTQKINEIEVFTKITLKELINEQINIENYEIDTNEIGEKKLKIKYKNKFTYEDEIKVNVIDKEPPKILVSNLTIETQDIDLVNRFICADNYDAKPNCYIEGTYNTNEIGTYKLKYIAVDTSNNKTEKEFTLKVTEKQQKEVKNDQYTDFQEIINQYKKENTKIGIDVSKWQEEIDFEKVKNAGCEFVIIKVAGTGSMSSFRTQFFTHF